MLTKETRLGRCNAAFDVVPLKEMIDKNDAGSWGFDPIDISMNVVRSTNFNDTGYLDLSNVAKRFLVPETFEELKLEENEILIERSGGSENQPVGRVSFITKEVADQGFAYANFIQRISAKPGIDPKYLFYCLYQMHSAGFTQIMQNQTNGIRNLEYRFFLKQRLPKPKFIEQQKIAAILSSIDNSIKATRTSIEKLDRLKKSLMQNLLTGKIKPDGSWRKKDEFYIDEKLGEVPTEWSIIRLKEVGKFIGGATPDTNDKANWNGSINWLVPSDISKISKAQKYLSQTSQQITDKGYKSSSTILLPVGSLCLSSRATIGDCIITEVELCTNQGFINIVFDQEGIALPLYILYWIRFNKDHILRYSAGTTFKEIGRTTFKKIKMLLPKKEEQLEIITGLNEIDELILEKENKLFSLIKLKKSLMQKLLTGQVRVK